VRDHPRLAAPGACQDQKGAIDVLNGGALLGVQTGEKIHWEGAKAQF